MIQNFTKNAYLLFHVLDSYVFIFAHFFACSVLLPLSDSYLAFTLCRLAVALLLPANLALIPAEILRSGPGAAHPDNAASMWTGCRSFAR